MNAWVRLLRLMEKPEDIPALASVYEREIPIASCKARTATCCAIATPDSMLARINRAIQRIRRDYRKPLRVAALAEQAAMSESAFHRHFKNATALSPLQYHKQLRLLQARQLLTAHGKSVTAAALDVGYESPTQFSREYARTFGRSPLQDAARITASFRQSAPAWHGR